jgi:hypothetical protein
VSLLVTLLINASHEVVDDEQDAVRFIDTVTEVLTKEI